MYNEYVHLEKRQQPSGLRNCYLDFMLSRQAMLCTPSTMKFYQNTLEKFLNWLETQGVNEPTEITARHVRAFIASFAERKCSDSYIHTFARSIRTFIHFLYDEEYIPKLVVFQMPKIGEKRLPILSILDVQKALNACETPRNRAILLLMVDTGLRRSETCGLNWGDIDISTGLCHVHQGKGKKDRTVVIGIKTRRAIIKYKQKLASEELEPLFQTSTGKRFSAMGLRSMLLRISKKSGVPISPHALRRTFVVMSLKSGMSLAHVQALMGHASPIMTLAYARLVEDDLLTAHQQHGPVDSFIHV